MKLVSVRSAPATGIMTAMVAVLTFGSLSYAQRAIEVA